MPTKKGLPVSGHHQFKYGFDRAMEYPFHSIEHMPSDAVLSDEDILKMAKRNVAIVPTMTVGQSYLMEEAFDELPRSTGRRKSQKNWKSGGIISKTKPKDIAIPCFTGRILPP